MKKTCVVIIAVVMLVFLFYGVCLPAVFTNANCQKTSSHERILTIVMYHQILKNSKVKSRYIVTPAMFESDLQQLLSRGYKTILPSEIIDFVELGAKLPQKPLLITFDDGHYNNLHYCKPILEKYNCKAVLNIIGQFSEYSSTSGDHSNVNYSHMTWQQIKSASESGVFEIGNHTYSMHKYSPRMGIKQMNGENTQSYISTLKTDIVRLQNKLSTECGVTPRCFAYPFGAYSKTAENVLCDLGFKVLLNCNEHSNCIKRGDSSKLLHLGRFNREPNLTAEQFFSRIEKAKVV